ncbi:MAG: hypothetical protein ACTSWN_09575 [Promethearchaeota archaeon]
MSLIIQLDKNFYFPNEIINGNVVISIKNIKKAKSLEIQFKGFEKCYIMDYSDEDAQSHSSTRVIVEEQQLVWDADKDGPLQMMPVTIPFQLSIPSNVLPSINPEISYPRNENAIKRGMKRDFGQFGTGYIKYIIRAVLHLKKARDKKTKVLTTIIPKLHEIKQDSTEIARFSQDLGKLGVHLLILRQHWSPGEMIRGQITIFNKAGQNINKCVAKLECLYMSWAHGAVNDVAYVADKYAIPLSGRGLETPIPFELNVPPLGPFTVNGHLVRIEWYIIVALDLPLKKNVKLSAPIYLVPIQNLSF